MFFPTYRLTMMSALSFVLLSCPAHADENPVTVPFSKLTTAVNAKTMVSVAYAPDGKTLWLLNRTDDLQIWSLDDERILFAGKFPRVMRELRVMTDGSLLVRSTEGDLFWYEQPQPGQPLQMKREFIRPEPFKPSKRWLDMLARLKPSERKAMTGHSTSAEYDGGELAISPDEKRVAVSTVFDNNQGRGAVGWNIGDLALVHVWNLESGKMESQTRLSRAALTAEQSDAPPDWVSAPRPPFRPTLAWNKTGDLKITSRGLSITPTLVSDGENLVNE